MLGAIRNEKSLLTLISVQLVMGITGYVPPAQDMGADKVVWGSIIEQLFHDKNSL